MSYSLIRGTLLRVNTDRRMITVDVPNEEWHEVTLSYPESISIKEDWILDKIGKDVAFAVKDHEIVRIS